MNGHASMPNVSMKSPEKGFLLVGGDGGASFAPHPSRHHHHHHHPLNEERAESSWRGDFLSSSIIWLLELNLESKHSVYSSFLS